MKEIWKDIPGFEKRYMVSNMGRVYSLLVKRVLKTCVSNRGYELVCLKNKDGKRKQYTIHRIVAQVFVSNPNNYPIINHKDENKLNNRADNLEWCTYSYNNSYGENQNIRARIKKTGTKCWVKNLVTNEILCFDSIREGERHLKGKFNITKGKNKIYKNWYISFSPL